MKRIIAISLRSSSDAVLVAFWFCLFGAGVESVGCTVRKDSVFGIKDWLVEDMERDGGDGG